VKREVREKVGWRVFVRVRRVRESEGRRKGVRARRVEVS